MNYKSACMLSWSLIALAAVVVITVLSSIDLLGVINYMLGV